MISIIFNFSSSQLTITFDITLLTMYTKDLYTIFQVIMFMKSSLSQTYMQ